MNENEIKDIIEKESTRSIMIFLERNETDLWPRRLPRANPKFEDEPEGSSFITKDNLNFSVTPTMNDGSVADWDVERSRENLLEGFTWYSIGTFRGDGTQVGVWSDPILIKIGRDGVDGTPGTDGNPGKDGRDGVDGAAIEYIYYLCANQEEFDSLRNPDPPVDPRYPDDPSPEHADETGWCPTDEGWTPSPQGIDSTHKIEAMCYRKLSLATNKWTTCFGPYKWSVWGNNGKDGDGVEYVYITVDRSCMLQNEDVMDETICRQMNIWPPTNPNNPDDALIINSSEYQSTDREYVPNGWFDEPQDVTFLKPYQFVSVRKYNGSTKRWGPFSEPSLWNKRILADKSFTIYRSFETYEVPATPGVDGWGGWWDVQENILMDVPDGWTTVPPTTATYNWASGASFESSEGKQITRWSPPQQINTIDLTIESVTRWFQANNQETGVEAPNTDVDPSTVGWSVEVPTINNENPYLWGFDRYIYTDGSIWQTVPCIIRYFNAEAQMDYEQIRDDVEEQIQSDLIEVNERLESVQGNYAVQNIDSEEGLIEIITNYKDDEQTSFADIIVNAGAGTIKQQVGAEIWGEGSQKTLSAVGQELNAVGGRITTAATQAKNEAINDARTEWSAADASITQSVSKSHYCWVLSNGEQKDYNFLNKTSSETYDQYEARVRQVYPGISLEVIVDEMSSIKQEADKISLLVGSDGQLKAGIQIIANSVPDGGSKIELDATKIVLNGDVISTAIQTNGISVGTGTGASFVPKTIISSNGILKTQDAHIDGDLYSRKGFFGIYEYEQDGNTPKPINGIYIGSFSDGGGLYSSNFYTSDSQLARKGFGLFGSEYYFFGEDGSYITKDAIVTRKVTASKNGFITSIDENGFTIKKDDEALAEFIVDPDNNNYIRLRIKGPDGWCDITGSGQNVHTNTETVIIEPKWTEVRYGMLSDQEELYYDFEQGHTWADNNIGAPQFEVPTINTYYLYSCGYKITTVTESGSTTRKTTYLNPSTGQYQDTRPEQDGKYYVYKNFSEEAQLGKYTIFSYPSGFNTILISDYPGHYYYVYDFEFQESDGSIHFVRAQKLHSAASDSGTLKGGEELEITYRTDVEDYGK